MRRVRIQRLDRTDFDNLTRVHDRHPIAHLGHQSHVVPDHDHGNAELITDLGQGLCDYALNHHIQGTGGFVGDDNRGVKRNRHSDANTLFHASRQLVWIQIHHPARQSHPLEQIRQARGQLASYRLALVSQNCILNLGANFHGRV